MLNAGTPTPLELAINKSDIPCVKLLLSKGHPKMNKCSQDMKYIQEGIKCVFSYSYEKVWLSPSSGGMISEFI
jgi:ankyrin repeat protein